MNFIEKGYCFDSKEFINVYDDLPLWSAPFGHALLNTIEYKENIIALDIGCGTGFPTLEIAQRLGPASTVYGIDPWEEAFYRIQAKMKIYGIANVKLIKGSAERIPFDDNFFDLITSNNGINNIENCEAVLAEVYRAAKPGCQFIQTFNLPDTMKEFYQVYRNLLEEKNLKKELVLLHDHIHKHRKSADEMGRLLTKIGFKNISVSEDQFIWPFLNGTSMLNYSFIKMYFLESWKQIVSNQDIDSFFNELELRLNEYAEINEGLRLTIPFVCINCIK